MADNTEKDGAKGGTEMGNEAAEGIHKRNKGGGAEKPGSEPLKDRKNEHESGYGGAGGAPKRSSDQR